MARPRRVRQGALRVSVGAADGTRGVAGQSVSRDAHPALPRLDVARDEAYADAKKMLLEAQKGVKDEVLPELAEIDSATGNEESALAYYKKSLEDDQKELPPTHPDLVGERTMYAETLLATGQPEPARAQLELAHKALNDDMSALQRADVSFDYARALWLTRPAEHGKALQLARRGAADLRRQRAEDRALSVGASEDRQVAGERSRSPRGAEALIGQTNFRREEQSAASRVFCPMVRWPRNLPEILDAHSSCLALVASTALCRHRRRRRSRPSCASTTPLVRLEVRRAHHRQSCRSDVQGRDRHRSQDQPCRPTRCGSTPPS